MSAFRPVTSRMAPLPAVNVDTDQIIPASFLKVTDKQGMGRGLFAHWRFDEQSRPRPDFVLNRPEYADARILLAGDNFGCGSSREHAAWALQDHGFEVVVSTGFADIFRANAAKNGLLTAIVSADDHGELLRLATESPASEVTVDLEQQIIAAPGGQVFPFTVDPFVRHCLLEGLDQLGYLLEQVEAIDRYERRHPQQVDTQQDGRAG